MLVLAVQLDESRGEVTKRRGCREGPVDERPATSLAADLAPDDQFATIGVLEDRFDRRLRFTGSNKVRGRSGAQEKAYGFNQDGLAGPGFAREYIEPGFELDLHGLDDRKVPDAEETQHASGTAIVSYV